jgi:ribonucleoside-triphosphate reductase (formate)
MRLSLIFDFFRGRGAIMFENIRKRDGQIVGFDSSKITSAIAKAGKATADFGEREARRLTLRVLSLA